MSIIILDPVGMPADDGSLSKRQPISIQSTRVSVLNNKWKSMDVFAEQMNVIFREQYGAADVKEVIIPIANAAPRELLDAVVSTSDLAVVGLAN